MIKQIYTTRIFDRNYNSKCPVIVNVGGARSSKTHSILQLFLQKFVNEDNKQILIARKTLPALKRTAYRLFLNLSEDYGYYKYCIHNKTDYTLRIKNNNIDFLSVDNIEKIKSTEYNYIFLEEANEFSQLDYRIIHTRLSGQTTSDEPNRLILALNPSDLYGWINQSLIHESGVEVIHSSYLDNPFLSEEYIKILLDLKKSDPALYQIYCLGEWAEISNIVYNNYIIEPSFPETFDDEIYGLDYGYHNPSALMWVGFKDDELYVREMIYQTNLTNQDLINKMISDDINKKIPMYADSSEPDRIEEAHRAGFNILPAKKGKNSVFDGIDTLKRYRIHIHEEDINYIKEHRSYKWKEDKNGNVLDEPVKFNDHAEDGVRMAVFSYAHRPPQIKSIPTSVGGGVLGRLRG